MWRFKAGLVAISLMVGANAATHPEFATAAGPQIVSGVQIIVEGEGGNSVVGARPRPNTSNLNFNPGVTVPNLVTVRVPLSGLVSFYNDAGDTDVIVDVVGFYSDERLGDAGRFRRVMPIREFDTREFDDPLGPDEVGIFKVAGYDYSPDNATSVIMNITAVAPTSGGYLSVFPDDVCTLPTVSNHNFVPGQTIPNMVIARLSLDRECAVVGGAIDVYNATGSTHVLIDIAGYFL